MWLWALFIMSWLGFKRPPLRKQANENLDNRKAPWVVWRYWWSSGYINTSQVVVFFFWRIIQIQTMNGSETVHLFGKYFSLSKRLKGGINRVYVVYNSIVIAVSTRYHPALMLYAFLFLYVSNGHLNNWWPMQSIIFWAWLLPHNSSSLLLFKMDCSVVVVARRTYSASQMGTCSLYSTLLIGQKQCNT